MQTPYLSLKRAVFLSKNAFTLVEVLVVLAIVALLAAIVFPVFDKVRESAKTTSCQSNLRQIGVAMELYATDYRNQYPSALAHAPNCSWTENLAPYTKGTAIFTCPKAPNEFYQAGCLPDSSEDEVAHRYDGGYIFDLPDSARFTQLSQLRIRVPSQFILVLDGLTPGGFTQAGPGQGPVPVDRLKSMGLEYRHNNGLNVLFADGHVKWLAETILTDRSYWSTSGRS